jgi:hypothetical protein
MAAKKAAQDKKPGHYLYNLLVTKASCTCGAQFELSDTLSATLSPAHCQDELLDLYHRHKVLVEP